MQTTFWVSDPSILFRTETISELWPTKGMTMDENLNAITRLTIVLTLVGFMISKNYRVIAAGIITIILIIILRQSRLSKKYQRNEGFSSSSSPGFAPEKNIYKHPTKQNPLMNVLLTEIQDNPNRPSAQPSYDPEVVNNINKKTQDMVVSNFDNPTGIQEKLFRDLGDNFQFDRSMIHFNSTANTQIPNDQKSFAEFCYGDMMECKTVGDIDTCVKNIPP